MRCVRNPVQWRDVTRCVDLTDFEYLSADGRESTLSQPRTAEDRLRQRDRSPADLDLRDPRGVFRCAQQVQFIRARHGQRLQVVPEFDSFTCGRHDPTAQMLNAHEKIGAILQGMTIDFKVVHAAIQHMRPALTFRRRADLLDHAAQTSDSRRRFKRAVHDSPLGFR